MLVLNLNESICSIFQYQHKVQVKQQRKSEVFRVSLASEQPGEVPEAAVWEGGCGL